MFVSSIKPKLKTYCYLNFDTFYLDSLKPAYVILFFAFLYLDSCSNINICAENMDQCTVIPGFFLLSSWGIYYPPKTVYCEADV